MGCRSVSPLFTFWKFHWTCFFRINMTRAATYLNHISLECCTMFQPFWIKEKKTLRSYMRISTEHSKSSRFQLPSYNHCRVDFHIFCYPLEDGENTIMALKMVPVKTQGTENGWWRETIIPTDTGDIDEHFKSPPTSTKLVVADSKRICHSSVFLF